MPNLANITLVGHLGRDPDIKVMPSGDPIAEFSIAHTFHRKSGDVTTWWRCTAFGRSAEIASQFLAKGDAVCFLGTAYNEPWTDKDGADRLTLRCMVAYHSIITPYESYSLYIKRLIAEQPKLSSKITRFISRRFERFMFSPYGRTVVLSPEDKTELLGINPKLKISHSQRH